MRTLRYLSEQRRRRIARETLDIYAPLANRLGIWQVKWELEDLALRYLDPEAYHRIASLLDGRRIDRERHIELVRESLFGEFDAVGVTAEIAGRPKHIYSIWRKMRRKNIDFHQIFDVQAVRVLVDSPADCYTVLGIVHGLWHHVPHEFDDYIANPKANNYRSLHTAVIGPEGRSVEVQIRTHEMHEHAELGIAAHWRYKEGAGSPAAFDQKINFLRQLLEPANDGSELLDQIRDEVFEDRVYAISPKGDVVELAPRATPLDFAYHVHTQVGHRCRGAKVNGRIVPLTYRIRTGDRVEIITGSQPNPSRDWLSPKLGYIAGAKTRAKVRNWFRQQDRDEHVRAGREILDRELARLSERDMPLDRIAGQLKYRDVDALAAALGSGDITTASIATALQQLRPAEETRQPRKRKLAKPQAATPDSISVTGVGGLLSNFARCCRPVPPEAIVGYITQGRGVSIHRSDCGNFLGLERRHPERILEVNWGSSDAGRYPVDLTLRAFDRSGLIRDISTILADEDANVIDLTSRTDKKSMQTIMQISLEIHDLPTLSTAMTRLEQLPNVVSVTRTA
jgi:GTP pyrophosphokinase